MSVAFNSPLTSANTNSKLMSRTQNTDTVGTVDVLNATESTAITNGALHTTGGLGVEKNAHINHLYVDGLTGDKVPYINALKKVVESAVTPTELGYVSGVTSSIQAQINLKADDNVVVKIFGNQVIAGDKTFTGLTTTDDLVVDGDLTVNGTTTTVNSATLDVTDTNITVNNTGNDATAEGAGLTVERTGTYGSLVYENALASKFKAGALGAESEIITSAFAQSLSGDKTFSGKAKFNGELNMGELVDSSSTGSNAIVPSTSPAIRLTNASLVSIANFDDVSNGKFLVVTNSTGSTITIVNNGGGTAIKRILTGTGADLSLKDNASLVLSYNSNETRWMVVGGSGGGSVSFQETPAGAVNGVNVTYGPLTYLPTNDDSVMVFVDGLALKNTEFSVSGSTITLSVAPVVGQSVYAYYSTEGSSSLPVFGGIFKVEFRTLSAGEITAKQLTLGFTPSSPSEVMLDLIGGGAQFYGDDYTVSGSVLSWSSLSLDGLLTAGDKIRISYVN